MDRFSSLPPAKQQAIIDAGLLSFGANGYKKASAGDIAELAGISKSMIFHYFGSKKALYLYLADLCLSTIKNEVIENFDKRVRDFFDRISLATKIKVAVLKKHPAVLSFLNSMYRETNREVDAEIKEIISREAGFGFDIIFEDLDISKFKDRVDPQLVMKMLSWLSEGYINKFAVETESDIDRMTREFDACLSLLKSNLYKEV